MLSGWPVWRIETEKRRLVILQQLHRSQGYQASASLLRLHCCQLGVPSTDDQIAQALTWLADHELVELRDAGSEIVARITGPGRDVSTGLRAVPGVLRPDP